MVSAQQVIRHDACQTPWGSLSGPIPTADCSVLGTWLAQAVTGHWGHRLIPRVVRLGLAGAQGAAGAERGRLTHLGDQRGLLGLVTQSGLEDEVLNGRTKPSSVHLTSLHALSDSTH